MLVYSVFLWIPWLEPWHLFGSLAVIILTIRTVYMRRVKNKPIEKCAVVFRVKWDDSEKALRAKAVRPGDDLYYEISEKKVSSKVHIGKVTRVDEGVIEAQCMGKLLGNSMMPEGVATQAAGLTEDASYILVNSQSACLTNDSFVVKAAQICPAGKASTVQPEVLQG